MIHYYQKEVLNFIDPVVKPPANNCWCGDIPYYWPYWVGGNEDFVDQGQPFHIVEELRQTTMLEF